MSVTVDIGYCGSAYCIVPYATGLALCVSGFQFNAQIVDRAHAIATQNQTTIATSHSHALQINTSGSSEKGAATQQENRIEKVQSSGVQFLGAIEAIRALGLEMDSSVQKQRTEALQLRSIIEQKATSGLQLKAEIENAVSAFGTQLDSVIVNQKPIGAEFEAQISKTRGSGFQFNGNTGTEQGSGFQFRATASRNQGSGLEIYSNSIVHSYFGYCTTSYCYQDYCKSGIIAHLPFQFSALADRLTPIGIQFSAKIDRIRGSGIQFSANIAKTKAIGTQFFAELREFESEGVQFSANITKMRGFATQFAGSIFAETSQGVQFEAQNPKPIGFQFRSVLYNATNLRILSEFPSRGNGSNWTASSTAAGDFGILNVNDDIVEHKWKSVSGVKTGIVLQCDTGIPQGIFLDTLALLNHNMTRSANVVVQGANNPIFSPSGESFTLQIDVENAYYIAPTLPNNGYRYWRITIDDASNQDNFIAIGTIVFGSSSIFQGECFSNPLRFSKKNYVDEVFTEGHTNVGNDRGIKKTLGLTFEKLLFSGGNYATLTNLFYSMRTTHKALWIPTPQYPSRYAIFGKISELPQETHLDIGIGADYVSLDLTIDESR
jgi:hypothetical protein